MKRLLTILLRHLRTAFGALIKFLIAPMTWLLLLAFGGAASISIAIFLLYGSPFAMISGGVFSLVFAFIIFRGMGKEG